MGKEENSANNQLTKKWIIVPLVLSVLITSTIIISLFGIFYAEEKNDSILTSNMDSLLDQVKDRAGVLFHVNASTFAVANSLESTKINSSVDLEKKVAPKLFIALLTTQFATQVSYIRKDGLVFSYECENGEISVIFSNNSGPCSFYNQKINQQTGALNGDIVALKCNDTKKSYSGAYDSESQYASVNGETLTFTFLVGNFNGVVSIGVNLKDILKYISDIDFVEGRLFFAINGSTLAPLDENGLNYEHLSSMNMLRSAHIDIGEISLVFTLAFPYKQIKAVFQVTKIILVCLVSLTILFLVTLIIIMVKLLERSQVRETILRADLIKQKEAVQQAERKSMNKSMAFAQASHDVRNSLYSITGLIDNCRVEVAPESELARDLEDMKSCASNLLGILNSILDRSKVESGKIHLQVTEFDISKMIEESVDFLYISAHKKGLEIIWDPCDFSVLKLGKVQGDAMRFKQVLDNLLGNAVKFTNEGRVVLRAWARKPNLKISNVSSDYGFSLSRMFCGLSRRVLRNRRNEIDQQVIINSVQNDPFAIELIFEVDDTGVGIPVEKRASVFENYVQVKDGSLFLNKEKEDKPQGTGLGLGIVQSFVRLMGGEISIQDKGHEKNGTCFNFNIFLNSSDHFHDLKEERNESTSQFPVFYEPNTVKGVHSLIFVRGYETKKILTRWMESLGIKVWTAQEIEHISPTLEMIRKNLNSSSKSDSILFCNTFSRNSSTQEQEGFLSADCERVVDSAKRKSYFGGITLRILIIVDISKGNLLEIWSSLRDFISNNPYILCKIACISDLTTPSEAKQKFKTLTNCDLIMKKPVHGSKLQSLFELIQDLERMDEGELIKEIHQPFDESKEVKNSVKQKEIIPEIKIKIEDEKLLSGMRILYAEDIALLRSLGSKILVNLGATVELAENGLIALQLVKQGLETGITRGVEDSCSFTYDIVLMDCQMPLMNGYEATREIRAEETRYGIHVPIIALTANSGEEEERKSALAGMDFHMPKPLERNRLLEAIGVVLGNKG